MCIHAHRFVLLAFLWITMLHAWFHVSLMLVCTFDLLNVSKCIVCYIVWFNLVLQLIIEVVCVIIYQAVLQARVTCFLISTQYHG